MPIGSRDTKAHETGEGAGAPTPRKEARAMRDSREEGHSRRGHRHGPEGWEGPWAEGWGGGRRRGSRMRRGDIRTALLAVLVEEPGHGYDVIQRLEEKTGGAW